MCSQAQHSNNGKLEKHSETLVFKVVPGRNRYSNVESGFNVLLYVPKPWKMQVSKWRYTHMSHQRD